MLLVGRCELPRSVLQSLPILSRPTGVNVEPQPPARESRFETRHELCTHTLYRNAEHMGQTRQVCLDPLSRSTLSVDLKLD